MAKVSINWKEIAREVNRDTPSYAIPVTMEQTVASFICELAPKATAARKRRANGLQKLIPVIWETIEQEHGRFRRGDIQRLVVEKFSEHGLEITERTVRRYAPKKEKK